MSVDFGLSPDQQAVEELFHAFFTKESPPSVARAAEPLGFDRSLWEKLAATGAPGMGVEGAGLGELVVAAEELGRAIAPVPLVEHLAASRAYPEPDLCDGSSIATISVRPAVDGVWSLVPAGAIADVVVGVDGDELIAVRATPPGDGPRNHASAPLADRSTDGERIALGPASDFARVRAEWQTLTAGALVGIAGASLDLAVEYAKARYQFGVPIGSFQAVKHALADVKVKLEYARPLVYRAADSVARALPRRSVHVSMAKVAAAEAALRCARAALQAHGAIGYTWEQDVHIWMRRAWSLDYTWGSQRFHRARMAEFALAPGAPLGAGRSFS